MDIGTAKPTSAEQTLVPHHLLDLVDPGENLSAGEFKQLAEAAITDIAGRGRVPMLVGGSGLYIDSVLFDYQFPDKAEPTLRGRLEAMSDNDLRLKLRQTDPSTYEIIDTANRRRVIRALETAGSGQSKRLTQLTNCLTVGLSLNKEVLQHRITVRIEKNA